MPFTLLRTLLPLVVGLASVCAASPRPNFVFIIGDDISAEDLGCYGNAGIRTPNIDRMAAEGLRFTNAYLTASSCSPSRCSIITSRYPHNLGTASELHAELPPGIPLFPTLLRRAGYHTVHSGKAHFGTSKNGGAVRPVGPAVEAFDVGGDGEVDELKGGKGGENRWLDHLRTRPPEKPFFMWFASHDAHRNWDPSSFSGINRPSDVTVPPYLVDTPETRLDLARYYDEITRLDYHVGEVLRELKRQGVLEQTVVIVMADNGRPFPHSKTQLYDDGIKTPVIIRAPQLVKKTSVVEGLVSSIDLAPTILEIAGVTAPPSFQGVSLLPMFANPAALVRDFVFAERNWHNFTAHVRMVRSGDFVYLRNAWPDLPLPGASDTFYNPSADALKELHAAGKLTEAQRNVFLAPRPSEEFYDLRTDPQQLKVNAPLPANHPVLGKLRAVLTRWERETGDTVQSKPTPTDIDYKTGKKTTEFWRGIPAGAEAHATQINHPGPVRDR